MIEQFEQIFPIVFPFFFIGLWCIVAKYLSTMSGWTALAEKYHFLGTFQGDYYRFQSVRMNRVNMSGSLEIGINEKGLYLIPMILFRLFHKPLFIPWPDIHAEHYKKIFSKGYRLKIKTYPDISLEINKEIFKRMDNYIHV